MFPKNTALFLLTFILTGLTACSSHVSHRIVRSTVTSYDRSGQIVKSATNSFRYDSLGRLSAVLVNDTLTITYTYIQDTITEHYASGADNRYVVNKQGYLLKDQMGTTRTDYYEYDKDGYAQKWTTTMSTPDGRPLVTYVINHQWINGNMSSSKSEQQGFMSTDYDYYPDQPYQPMAPSFYTQGKNMKNLMKTTNTTFRGTPMSKSLKYEMDKEGRISQYTISQSDNTKSIYTLLYQD